MLYLNAMKLNKKVSEFFKLTGIGLGLLGAISSKAQMVYSTVPLTGFTDDVVCNVPGPANASANNDMDGGIAPVRYCFVTQNYQNPAGARPTSYLPATGFFNSAATPGLSFQLADYNTENTLRIKGIGSGTLNFVTPRAAQVIYLLGGAGNSQQGNTNFNITISFTDGTNQFASSFFTDWFGMLDVVALQGVSRVNFDNSGIENSSINPSLYQKPINILPANQGKLIQSITIDKTGTLATINVLAVSVGSSCNSAPAAGNTVASVATINCPTNVSLSLTGASNSAGLVYQWQQSVNNGANWTDIAGANSSTYVAKPVQTTQFRARLACGTQAATSTPITVTLTPLAASISYSASSFCQLGRSGLPTVNPKGGTYSGTPGLVINATTGDINLASSTAGQHKVTYNSGGACPAQGIVTINIGAALKPEFPNIITPNGDAKNDTFKVTLPTVSEYKMRIFNRWGTLVWENSNAAEGWTGSNDGVYYYHVQFKDCTGNKQNYKGWVEVVSRKNSQD
jgi:gliding motility-associated-like protein